MAGSISLADYAAQSQSPMRKGLVNKITNESIFMRILRFIPCEGFFYEYGMQLTLGGIAFRGINESYTPNTGVINPAKEVLAILGGAVQTDRQLAKLNGGAARVNAILAKTQKAGLFFDKYCIDGDPAVIPKSFYGLNSRLTGNQVKDLDGMGMELTDIDDLLDRVAGPNTSKILVMCKSDLRALKFKLLDMGSGTSLAEVGSVPTSYDGAKIEVLDEDGDEQPILAHDEPNTSANSVTTSSIYAIRPGADPEGDFVQGLVGAGMIEHDAQGIVGTQLYDLVEMRAGLGVFHPRAAARLKGIAKQA